MARLNRTRKRGIQLGTRQQEVPYFPIVKYIHPDKRLGPEPECPNEMHGKGSLLSRHVSPSPCNNACSNAILGDTPDIILPPSSFISPYRSRAESKLWILDGTLCLSFSLASEESYGREDIYKSRFSPTPNIHIYFRRNAETAKVRWISGGLMPRTFPLGSVPWSTFHGAHRYAFSVGRRKKHKGETERKKRTRRKKSMHPVLWPLAVPFVRNAVPSGRTVGREHPVNALSDGSFLFFFFFLSVSFFCACAVVCAFLSRSLAYSITSVSCYGIGRVQHSRLPFRRGSTTSSMLS